MADTSAQTEISYLPPSAPPANHGHTRAAWFTTIVVVLGSTIVGVAMCIAMLWLVWVGAAVVLVGLVGGKLLSVAGYGQGALGTSDANAH
ncbi:HGxxPAAW family protein [Sanguibacter sp. 25GB23B1]|uniref:HGxxPAAW family protein n=1 Tax=unclassified Sanguibacter TaxID=2645534 RepID=UPI0032AF1AD4